MFLKEYEEFIVKSKASEATARHDRPEFTRSQKSGSNLGKPGLRTSFQIRI